MREIEGIRIGDRSKGNFIDAELVIVRYLKRQQAMGKPGWFDGSYFYFLSGKYGAFIEETTGRFRIRKLHNLSLGGIFNHFPEPPCEYVICNQKALEIYQERKLEEERKRKEWGLKQSQEKQKQDAYTEKCELLACEIRQWIELGKVRGKAKLFRLDVPSGEMLAKGMVYAENFGIHKPEIDILKKEYPYRVTHIPTGFSVGDFPTRKSAREFVFGIWRLGDWSFTDVKGMDSSLMMPCRTLLSFCRGEGIGDVDRFQTLVDFTRSKLVGKTKGFQMGIKK